MIFHRPNQLRNWMDKKKIIKGVQLLIEGIGEDPHRDGLKRTPERVYEFFKEFFDDSTIKIEKELRLYITPNKDELVIVKDISFFSMCEHHLLPFFGKVHIAYIPQKNKITGFSSLVRVVEYFSHRPTIQEKLTSDIADTIYKKLDAKGLLVIIEAEHLCMTMIGVKKSGAKTTTSAVRGILRRDATRSEALMLIKQ